VKIGDCSLLQPPFPGAQEAWLKPSHLSACEGGTRVEGAVTVLEAEEGAATRRCCGAKKSRGPAERGRETCLAEARELPRRGLLASPLPSCL